MVVGRGSSSRWDPAANLLHARPLFIRCCPPGVGPTPWRERRAVIGPHGLSMASSKSHPPSTAILRFTDHFPQLMDNDHDLLQLKDARSAEIVYGHVKMKGEGELWHTMHCWWL
jgi:hypothetical protein